MRKRLPLSLKARLILLGTGIALLFILHHDPTVDRAKDAWAWMTKDGLAVSDSRQHATAYHEAGHVVASAALRGTHSLQSVKVYHRVWKDDDGTLYGNTDTNVAVRPGSRDDALRVAAMLHAGGLAEQLVIVGDSDGDRRDLGLAAAVIASYRTDASATLKKPDSTVNLASASVEAIETVMADERAAIACAEAVVDLNAAVIAALADEILKQPPIVGRRHMSNGQLAEFFSRYKALKPHGVCSF